MGFTFNRKRDPPLPRKPQQSQSPTRTESQTAQENQLILPEVVSERKIRAVNYDTTNHWGVISQMHGSVWPKVIPYCICNVLNVLLVDYLKKHRGIDLTFSDRGHFFMSMMVSFLVVTRSNIAYSRYMEARSDLNQAMKACRELIQHTITFTRYDTSTKAKDWRSVVARRTIVLLRTVVSVLEFETSKVHAWKVPELTQGEKQALLSSVGKSNERLPMVLTMFMRSTISAQAEFLETPMHVNKELRLFSFVSDFVTAYHGLMKIVTTPFPFPLVQMARTFLFIWVFTLPFALVDDMAKVPALLFVVFFLTFGFVGLEFVSIELDDPFGDDPNDFDVYGLAQVVFEDIYIGIYDIDGKEAAGALRTLIGAPTERPKHSRINSVDAFQFSAPNPKQEVGCERSKLLSPGTPKSHYRSRTTSSSDIFSSIGLDLNATFKAGETTTFGT